MKTVSVTHIMGLLLIGAALVLQACASAPPKAQPRTGVIEPSDILEFCLQLTPREVLEYRYQASQSLVFEILTHGMETEVAYSGSEASSDSGSFYPETPQFYCLRWTNPHTTAAELTYEYVVNSPLSK